MFHRISAFCATRPSGIVITVGGGIGSVHVIFELVSRDEDLLGDSAGGVRPKGKFKFAVAVLGEVSASRHAREV